MCVYMCVPKHVLVSCFFYLVEYVLLLLLIWNWGDPQPSAEYHELVLIYSLNVIPELPRDSNC